MPPAVCWFACKACSRACTALSPRPAGRCASCCCARWWAAGGTTPRTSAATWTACWTAWMARPTAGGTTQTWPCEMCGGDARWGNQRRRGTADRSCWRARHPARSCRRPAPAVGVACWRKPCRHGLFIARLPTPGARPRSVLQAEGKEWGQAGLGSWCDTAEAAIRCVVLAGRSGWEAGWTRGRVARLLQPLRSVLASLATSQRQPVLLHARCPLPPRPLAARVSLTSPCLHARYHRPQLPARPSVRPARRAHRPFSGQPRTPPPSSPAAGTPPAWVRWPAWAWPTRG